MKKLRKTPRLSFTIALILFLVFCTLAIRTYSSNRWKEQNRETYTENEIIRFSGKDGEAYIIEIKENIEGYGFASSEVFYDEHGLIDIVDIRTHYTENSSDYQYKFRVFFSEGVQYPRVSAWKEDNIFRYMIRINEDSDYAVFAYESSLIDENMSFYKDDIPVNPLNYINTIIYGLISLQCFGIIVYLTAPKLWESTSSPDFIYQRNKSK